MIRVTSKEYATLLQILAEDQRSAGIQIKAQKNVENDLAVIIRFKGGEKIILNTWAEFNRWYTDQQTRKRSLQRVS